MISQSRLRGATDDELRWMESTIHQAWNGEHNMAKTAGRLLTKGIAVTRLEDGRTVIEHRYTMTAGRTLVRYNPRTQQVETTAIPHNPGAPRLLADTMTIIRSAVERITDRAECTGMNPQKLSVDTLRGLAHTTYAVAARAARCLNGQRTSPNGLETAVRALNQRGAQLEARFNGDYTVNLTRISVTC